jgi:aminomethyltransferase
MLIAEQLHAAGIHCADPEALDAFRIRKGAPSLADLAPGFMPAEVGGVEPAVSLTKGCYLGQEPVARLHYRGHPNRTLRQVRLTGDIPDDWFDRHVPTDSDYLALTYAEEGEGKRAPGTLTSWALDPEFGVVGLAVIRRDVEDGTALQLIDSAVGVAPQSM